MTSGVFGSIAIEQVIINRDERQRRELVDIPDLAESIKLRGLIQPIVITRELVLVAGERRIAACRSLGWTHINYQFADTLDPEELQAIELEENVKRSNLPWQDECKAVHRYHLLRKGTEPDWTEADTGKALGMSQPSVNEKLSVAEEILSGNERVLEAPRFSTARGIVERKKDRLADAALSEFNKIAKVSSPLTETFPDSIINANFLEWAPAYSGPKFNFIHCDFPYGIDADKFNQGAAPLHGGYSDTEEDYWKLLDCLALNLDRIASPSCHIMFWFSMHFYNQTLRFFNTRTDFIIDPFPLVWTKSDNIGILPDPSRGPRRIYETALFGARGDRKVVRSKSNAIALPSQRDTHMSIKPEPMLKHFFEMFVDSSSLVLDPTCGSGGALRAAESLGAANILGLEVNKEFAELAATALRKSRLMRKGEGK